MLVTETFKIMINATNDNFGLVCSSMHSVLFLFIKTVVTTMYTNYLYISFGNLKYLNIV